MEPGGKADWRLLDAGLRMREGWLQYGESRALAKGEAFARAKSRREAHSRNERARSGPRLPQKHANETGRGKWATVA